MSERQQKPAAFHIFPWLERLYIEAEMHDVTVLHHVLLAFHPEFSCFLYLLFGLVQKKVFTIEHLCLDEALFEVRMDDTGGLGGLVACMECPRTVFIRAGSKEGTHSQRMVGTADELVQPGFLQPHRLKELALLFLGLQHGNLRFNLAADDHHFRSLGFGDGSYGLDIFILLYDAVFIDVAYIDDPIALTSEKSWSLRASSTW